LADANAAAVMMALHGVRLVDGMDSEILPLQRTVAKPSLRQ